MKSPHCWHCRPRAPPRCRKFTPLVLNCTVPVGVPAPGATAVTVALNVTAWPNTEGLAEELTAVELLAWLTVWPPARVPLLVLKLLSPL